MKIEELRKIIEGISDEQSAKILDINAADCAAAIEEAQSGQGDAEKLSEKIEELQNILDRKQSEIDEKQAKLDKIHADEESRAAEERLTARFSEASGGAEFLNSYTRDGVYAAFRGAVEDAANAGRADSEIYDEIVRGREDLFAPSGDVPTVVASGGFGMSGELTDSDIREIMGL